MKRIENKKYKLENTDEVRQFARLVSEYADLKTINKKVELPCSNSMWYKILTSEGLDTYRAAHRRRVAEAEIRIRQEEEAELTARFRMAVESLGGTYDLEAD